MSEAQGTTVLEVCVDSVRSAVEAVRAGAQRIELCTALFEGGLTPSAGLIETTVQRVRELNPAVVVAVMIRPRAGDFVYDDDEFAVALADVSLAVRLGAGAIVFGALSPDGRVDGARVRAVADRAHPLPITFHRAIDMCCDLIEAVRDLAALAGSGVPLAYVLTSGGEATALDGAETIRLMCSAARELGAPFAIMAGGGVTPRNAARLVRETGASALHGTLRRSHDSSMAFRPSAGVLMGGTLAQSEFVIKTTDGAAVRAVHAALRCS